MKTLDRRVFAMKLDLKEDLVTRDALAMTSYIGTLTLHLRLEDLTTLPTSTP